MNKIKQTILYILDSCGEMSKDKLETMLYFIDFDYFEKHRKPFFTGLSWIKGKNHPELRFKPTQEENGKCLFI